MTRLDERGSRDGRLHAPVPQGHWRNSTFVAGMRMDGVVAPVLVDRPMNGAVSRAYAEQFLVPSLRPGDVVVMDNLQCEQAAHIRATIEAVGATLMLLPLYSPDLNPIEQLFSKHKAIARANPPRNFDAIIDTVRYALSRLTLTECANYIANSGYQRMM